MDEGHKKTEKELAALEKRIVRVYKEARDDLQKTVEEYFAKFADRDKHQQELLRAGKITEEQYKQWRLAQIGRGRRFEALRDQMAERYTRANETAVAYVNDATPSVYGLNRNYAAYTIEQVAGDIGFTLWDEQTVKRLIIEEPELMPYYPPERAVKRGIDLAWGRRQITASVTSSILQGKSIGKIADDLQGRIETMNRDSAIRTARTAVTGAQNAGRMDSYAAAEKMGISVRKRWIATKDNRTRHSHALLDGETIGYKDKFSNGLLYPGDPDGKPHEIYNCRCTIRTAEKENIEAEPRQMRVRDPETGRNVLVSEMTFEEWEAWKQADKIVGSVGSRKQKNGSVQNHAKQIAGILGVEEKNIQISMLPEDSQVSIEKQIRRAVEYFPALKGHLQSVVYDDTIRVVAESQSLRGTIKVGKAFLDYSNMVESYKKGEKFGFYAKGTSADSIVIHEIGHQIDGLLTKRRLFDGEIGQYGTIRSSKAIQKEILTKVGLSDQRLREIRQEWRDRGYQGIDLKDAVLWERKEFISDHVSEYATTNEREFFAECFSELLTSEHPREAALALGEILERAKEML